MGMGEPLLNYENMRRAVEIFTANWGGGFAPSRITISTAGIVPAIERMGRDMPGVNLAVSLNAVNAELRSRIGRRHGRHHGKTGNASDGNEARLRWRGRTLWHTGETNRERKSVF